MNQFFKTSISVVVGAAMVGTLAAQITPATEQELAQQRQQLEKANQANRPANEQLPAGEDPYQKAKDNSLIATSSMLVANGQWTLVPKAGVLFVPPHLAERIATSPKGKVVDWATFYQNNRTWLITCEVTLDQIQGKVPLDPNLVKTWGPRNCVVVATYKGDLVSMKNASNSQPK